MIKIIYCFEFVLFVGVPTIYFRLNICQMRCEITNIPVAK